MPWTHWNWSHLRSQSTFLDSFSRNLSNAWHLVIFLRLLFSRCVFVVKNTSYFIMFASVVVGLCTKASFSLIGRWLHLFTYFLYANNMSGILGEGWRYKFTLILYLWTRMFVHVQSFYHKHKNSIEKNKELLQKRRSQIMKRIFKKEI